MRLRRRRKRRWKDPAGDAMECGCCLGDVFAMSALAGAAVLWRRRR